MRDTKATWGRSGARWVRPRRLPRTAPKEQRALPPPPLPLGTERSLPHLNRDRPGAPSSPPSGFTFIQMTESAWARSGRGGGVGLWALCPSSAEPWWLGRLRRVPDPSPCCRTTGLRTAAGGRDTPRGSSGSPGDGKAVQSGRLGSLRPKAGSCGASRVKWLGSGPRAQRGSRGKPRACART